MLIWLEIKYRRNNEYINLILQDEVLGLSRLHGLVRDPTTAWILQYW
jgi:uncharacterized membrane protein